MVGSSVERNHFQLITKYRAAIMGFSILWVVLFHSSIMIAVEPLSTFQELGYGGVDIFLFLSGIGIFQSLQRNSICSFFKHRLNKILPVWWSYFLVRLIVEKLHLNILPSFLEMLGFVTLTGYWARLQHQGNWYVYAIMLFYALSPLFVAFINNAKQRRFVGPLLITVTIFASLPFYGQKSLMAFSRLPVFLSGMLFSAGREGKLNSAVDAWIRRICFFVGSLGLVVLIKTYSIHDLQHNGLCWYPFLLITPELTIVLAVIFDYCNKQGRTVVRLFNVLGLASLEVLLTSDSVMQWTGDWADGKWISFSIAAVSVVLGLAYHFLVEKVKDLSIG